MTNQFKLIEGTFTAEEASEILIHLFQNKIQFHIMKNVSAQERFGIDDPTANRRIEELKMAVENLSAMKRDADRKNQNIVIHSNVTITI